MKQPFHFKQFTVHQDQSAMKIGTDGVLLGAWTSLADNPLSILDIGAGTGLIALQMAQRSSAEVVDAIEVDEAAFEQCVSNFEASPWADRLFCYHAGLDEFVEEIDQGYDLIVSNPPFYSEVVSSGNSSRDNARQNQSLPFDELLRGVSALLSKGGRFATIIPLKEEDNFMELARINHLFVCRATYIKGNPNSKTKRVLLEFSFKEVVPKIEELIIEKRRHEYTEQYIELTKDFYLKM